MKKLLALFLVLVNLSAFSQNDPKIDSVKRLIAKAPADTSKANSLVMLGKLYIDKLDSAGAAQSFLKSISLSEKAGYKQGVINGYNEFGKLLELTQWPDKALGYYNKAVVYGKKNDLKEGVAVAYSNIYFVVSHKSEYKKAILYADSALTLFKALGKKVNAGNQYNNIGLMNFKMGNHKAALDFYNKAIVIYNSVGESAEVRKANTLSNIGLIYEALKSKDVALSYYKKSKAISEKHKNLDKIVEVNMNIGNVYWSQGKYDEAVKIYKQNLIDSKGTTNVLSFGIASANLANVYTDMGKFDEAEKYYSQAIAEYKKSGYQEGLWQTYLNYTRVLAEKKDYTTAEANLWKAFSIVKQIGQDDLRYMIYYSLAEIKKRQKDYDEAFRFQDSAFMLKDEVLNKSTNEKVASLQVQYETEQKEVELTKNKLLAAQQRIVLQRRNNLLILSFVILAIVVLASFYLIRTAKIKRRRIQEENELKLQLANSEAQAKMQEEKLRISGELHDNIGSQLTFIHSSIQNLKHQTSEAVKERVDETTALTMNTIRELRQTVWLINNAEMTLEEFLIRLREYLKPLRSAGPEFTIETESVLDIRFNSAAASNLFRIIQESINNSLKYSGASTILISFSSSPSGYLRLVIKDNGKGFDDTSKGSGFGLRNMEARAKALNGFFQLKSSPENGTQISLEMPV